MVQNIGLYLENFMRLKRGLGVETKKIGTEIKNNVFLKIFVNLNLQSLVIVFFLSWLMLKFLGIFLSLNFFQGLLFCLPIILFFLSGYFLDKRHERDYFYFTLFPALILGFLHLLYRYSSVFCL